MKKSLQLSGLMMFITLTFTTTLLKAQSITIDGDFADWNSVPYLHTNTVGTGGELTAIKAIAGADDIYFFLEGTESLTFSAFDMYVDRDDNAATGFLSGGYSSGSGAELLIQGDVSPSSGNVNVYTGSGPDWNWGSSYGYTSSDINLSALVSLAGKKAIEFSVKKSLLGTIAGYISFALINRVGWDATGSIPALDLGGSYIRVSTADATLPVRLTSFEAKPHTEGVKLSWNTLSEKNNSHFDIYRSIDGVNFEKIGFVNGNNNSSNLIVYNYIDKFPLLGRIYYQLEQVDLDGVSEKSTIVSTNSSGRETSFSLYHSKEQGVIEITVYAEEKGNSQFLFSDINGRILLDKELNLVAGLQTVSLYVKVTPGINIATLNTSTKSISQKLFID